MCTHMCVCVRVVVYVCVCVVCVCVCTHTFAYMHTKAQYVVTWPGGVYRVAGNGSSAAWSTV